MQQLRYRTAALFNQGDYHSGATALDTVVNVSPTFQHPAIIPQITATPGTLYTGADVTGGALSATTSGTWTSIETIATATASGAYIQFTTSGAVKVELDADGILTSGMGATSGDSGITAATIRNGGILNVLIDGVLIAPLDCYQSTPYWSYLLEDGGSHTIKLQHSGLYDASVVPVSTPVRTVGSTIAATATATPPTTFVAAKWRIKATSSSLYTIFKTPVGSTESTIATGLAMGTPDTTHVPGVSLLVTAAATNDEMTFATDVVMVGVIDVRVSVLTGNATGQYSSAVVDSGDPTTQWFSLQYEQNQPLGTVSLATSQNVTTDGSGTITGLAVDSTYVSTMINPLTQTLPSGTQMGVAGLQIAPLARYAQWTISFSTTTGTTPYMRNATLSWWQPQQDPHFMQTLAYGPAEKRRFGPVALAFFGTSAKQLADLESSTTDLLNAYAIAGATDSYLAAYGADQQLPQYTGEPPDSYQTRVAGAFQSRTQGGSLPFIAAQMAQLVYGTPQTVSAPIVGASSIAVTASGITASQDASRNLTITFPLPQAAPLPPYPGLPGLSVAAAQALISDYATKKLRPIGTAITLNF